MHEAFFFNGHLIILTAGINAVWRVNIFIIYRVFVLKYAMDKVHGVTLADDCNAYWRFWRNGDLPKLLEEQVFNEPRVHRC